MYKWERCVDFHGHPRPGLAIGFRACEAAREKMVLRFAKDEVLVCAKCGEGMAENTGRMEDGQTVCLDCHAGYTRGW